MYVTAWTTSVCVCVCIHRECQSVECGYCTVCIVCWCVYVHVCVYIFIGSVSLRSVDTVLSVLCVGVCVYVGVCVCVYMFLYICVCIYVDVCVCAVSERYCSVVDTDDLSTALVSPAQELLCFPLLLH